MDFIDAERASLALRARFPGISVRAVEETGSTNTDLLEAFSQGRASAPCVLAARVQTKGRGTRGRAWRGGRESLLFSIGLPSPEPRFLSPVPLIAGFSAAEALSRAGCPVAVKWPNDLWLPTGKLAGILCETVKTPSGHAAVIGTGLNLELEPPEERAAAAYPAAALADAAPLGEVREARTRWLEELSAAILSGVLDYFESKRMPDWSRWSKLDFLKGKRIAADNGAGLVLRGIAAGIDRDGALLLDDGGASPRRIISASIRVESQS